MAFVTDKNRQGFLEKYIPDLDRNSLQYILAGKPVSVRVYNVLMRRDKAHMKYHDFLEELFKPNGGALRKLRELGPSSIAELRRACAGDQDIYYEWHGG